ncbi:MAG: hypothetical protein LBI40_01460 [Treponema sp.]|nr:hypothetical protein [Treponema sp.]
MNDLDGKNEADSAVFDRYYTTVLSAAMSGKPVGTLDNAAACIDISIGVTDLALRARSEYLAGKENQKIEKAVKTPPEHSPVIIIRNALRDEVEKRTDGAVTVLYDDHELPSYMLIVPAFDVETVDSVLGRGRHPAFNVGGREVKEIFIGLKPATLIGAVAYCLPSRDRLYSITFDKAREVCNKKGKGWHMLNNWEYAALIMFLVKTNFKHFVRCWWEWVDGLKLIDGGFYFPRNNDFDKPESEWEYQRVCLNDDGYGAPMLSTSVTNYTENKGSNNHGKYTCKEWRNYLSTPPPHPFFLNWIRIPMTCLPATTASVCRCGAGAGATVRPPVSRRCT